MTDKKIAKTVKLSKEDEMIIEKAAEASKEGVSTFMRRAALEVAKNPCLTDKMTIRLMQESAYYMAIMNEDNFQEMLARVNMLGGKICQILSS